MERQEHYQDGNNTDNYINPDGWKPGRAINHLLEQRALKYLSTDPDKGLYSQPAPQKTTTLLVPKATITNTGIFAPISPSVVATKPVDANSPLILQPNVPGGMIVEKPGFLATIKAAQKAIQENPAPLKTAVSSLPTLSEIKQPTGALQAGGFKLPTTTVMILMVVAVAVMYFIFKGRKS